MTRTTARGILATLVAAALAALGLGVALGQDDPAARTTPPAPTRASATVDLAPLNGSGVSGHITLRERNGTLVVTGRVNGLPATIRATTLAYDVGSVATGPTACLPNPAAPTPLSADEMGTSDWQPVGATTRFLAAARVGPGFVPISRIGTMSVRQEQQSGPVVNLANILACGAVVVAR